MACHAMKLSVVESVQDNDADMESNEYTELFCDFIERVFEPSASFSRLLLSIPDNGCQPCSQADIGEVTAALTALVKTQMYSFANKLEKRVGAVNVSLLMRGDYIPVSVNRVLLNEEEAS